MPHSLKQALADALVLDHPDAPWQPPAQLPPAVDLRRGVAVLEGQLRKAEKAHVAYCLVKLFSGFNERMTKGEVDAKVDVWFETCAGVPNDLWSAGMMELLRTWRRDAHFGRIPEPADLLDVVKGRLEKRQLDLQRTQAMLRKANAAAEPAQPAGPIRRKPTFAEILEEQRNRPGLTDAQRLHVMAHTERSRAYTEKTPMADWAWNYFEDQVNARGDSAGAAMRQVVARSTPLTRRMADLAQAHRTGKPALEPEPDYIAEASHG